MERPIKNVLHPDLVCVCPECRPDPWPLEYQSPEERKKTYGDAMLFCPRSKRKHHAPAADVAAFIKKGNKK